MLSSLRTLATMSVAAFVGTGLLPFRAMTFNRVSAEDFKPIKEAEMPRGFPTYTPVGQIELKNYPACRKASASGKAQFWTLFQHIQSNRVQMTAPVEMDYGDPTAAKSAERVMSFLYENPGQGVVGKQGLVEVSDVPATTVVSIGCRGNQTAAAVSDARRKLLNYLAEKKAEYAVAGSMRVMGYNSPFVPRDSNFFEVQIPVKPAPSSSTNVHEGRQNAGPK